LTDRSPDDLSTILDDVRRGATGATDRLFGLVYAELKELAHGRMAAEGPGHILQTTALVNEAYLKLCKTPRPSWESRRHFFGAAARAMREILVDSARRDVAGKRGGRPRKVTLNQELASAEHPEDLVAIDRSLDRLAAKDARMAEVVKYRYFLGLTVPETARLLEVSPRTVNTDWEMAKAWLRRDLTGRSA
jgi:RNA polymerase sigma factor (TIGR02999 family)